MSQSGWPIWRGEREFPSIKKMVKFVESTLEGADSVGPDGTVTMVSWDNLPGGGVKLISIGDWQEGIVSQLVRDTDETCEYSDLVWQYL